MKSRLLTNCSGAIVEEALMFSCVIFLAIAAGASIGQNVTHVMYAAGGSISTAVKDSTIGTEFESDTGTDTEFESVTAMEP